MRPLPQIRLDERLQNRVTYAEKQAFIEAAELAGLDLTAWVRTRLRKAAARELRALNRVVPFEEPYS